MFNASKIYAGGIKQDLCFSVYTFITLLLSDLQHIITQANVNLSRINFNLRIYGNAPVCYIKLFKFVEKS